MKEYPQRWPETTKNHKKSLKIRRSCEKYWKLSKNKKFNKNHLKSRLFFSAVFLVSFNNLQQFPVISNGF